MPGILKIALKLLINDRSKFTALLVGITFAVFLMVMMTSMFSGILTRSSSSVYNIGAKIWVMDPAVNNATSSIPMPDYVLSAARSIKGVRYAVPLYFGTAQVKLKDGSYQAATVVGLDDATLYGRPELLEGNINDIYAENAFIVVKDAEYDKLGKPAVGSEFEINDHRGAVVGLAKVASSGLFGIPTIYTTYSRAITYIPSTRFTTSYILIEPGSESDIPVIQQQIGKLGYQALTRDQFVGKISDFYTFKTGMGMNILLMTTISFVVGLSISGQTFYTFILENLEKFGALKAIGAKSNELIAMILFQASFTSLIGYGLGVGAASTFMILARLRMPDYAAQITFVILGFALLMVLVIASVSSYIGVRKVLQIQPFDIFRG
ncbi:MAG: ABC transporter permease [Chlorobiaceae bacterium]|nr:ABC transporter permease [Chlorobiaceae bacterium]